MNDVKLTINPDYAEWFWLTGIDEALTGLIKPLRLFYGLGKDLPEQEEIEAWIKVCLFNIKNVVDRNDFNKIFKAVNLTAKDFDEFDKLIDGFDNKIADRVTNLWNLICDYRGIRNGKGGAAVYKNLIVSVTPEIERLKHTL